MELEWSLNGAHTHSPHASLIHSLMKITIMAHLVSLCVSSGWWRRRRGEWSLAANDNYNNKLIRPYLICDQIWPKTDDWPDQLQCYWYVFKGTDIKTKHTQTNPLCWDETWRSTCAPPLRTHTHTQADRHKRICDSAPLRQYCPRLIAVCLLVRSWPALKGENKGWDVVMRWNWEEVRVLGLTWKANCWPLNNKGFWERQ